MEWEDYWRKAEENLEMAALAYQSKRHNVCASRAYYAVFLASIAALIKLTNSRAKYNEWQHGQVQAELNRQLIMRSEVAAVRVWTNTYGLDGATSLGRLQIAIGNGKRSETSI